MKLVKSEEVGKGEVFKKARCPFPLCKRKWKCPIVAFLKVVLFKKDNKPRETRIKEFRETLKEDELCVLIDQAISLLSEVKTNNLKSEYKKKYREFKLIVLGILISWFWFYLAGHHGKAISQVLGI